MSQSRRHSQKVMPCAIKDLITKPVFDTLFRDNHFTKNNPVSKAMEIVLDRLHHHNIGKEAEVVSRKWWKFSVGVLREG